MPHEIFQLWVGMCVMALGSVFKGLFVNDLFQILLLLRNLVREIINYY